jgi:hypothetical protein
MVRYLREETILIFVFPPTLNEPSLEQLNKPFDLFIKDLKVLYNGGILVLSLIISCLMYLAGVELQVYGSPNVQLFHAQLNADVSDLPASHKLNGLQGFMSIHFMSLLCTAMFYSLTNSKAFKPSSM